MAESDFFVSICIPVRNAQHCLRQTLDSLVHQTYPNREIIVSDNVSDDGTPQIVRQYMEKYPIRFEPIQGPVLIGEYNFNRCISLARGEAVCVYHSDDIYEPDMVARCAETLKAHPEVGAVFTTARVINAQGFTVSYYRLPAELKRLNRMIFTFDEIFEAVLKNENSFLVCPSVMVRKSVYDRLGAWEYDKYYNASDLALWFKIARHYPIAIIDEPLIRYRVSVSQESQRLTRSRTGRDYYLRVLDDYLSLIKGHRYEKYYQASVMKDKVYRALNLSAQSRIPESRTLVKEALRDYLDRFKDLWLVPRASLAFIVAVFLVILNRLPFQQWRLFFHKSVMRFVVLKKRITSY